MIESYNTPKRLKSPRGRRRKVERVEVEAPNDDFPLPRFLKSILVMYKVVLLVSLGPVSL